MLLRHRLADKKNIREVLGGGSPPKEPSDEVMKTIALANDEASFRGLKGVSTFSLPSISAGFASHTQSLQIISESDSEDECMNSDNIRTELTTPIHTTGNISSLPSHSEDIQLKVRKKEEMIQKLKN